MLTELFRLYARWRLRRVARSSPVEEQRRTLMRLLRGAARTRFGVDHGFDRIDGVQGFQERVPLRQYQAFWEEYWAPEFPVLRDVTTPGLITAFALTSGTTTGATKYIPYTRAMSRGAMRGMLDLFCSHVIARPESRLFAGAAIMLSGPEALKELAPGVRAGDVSALAALNTPWLMRRRILPPPDIAVMHDWEEKIARIAGLSRTRRISAIGGSPNWILMYLDQVARTGPRPDGRLADWYPELDLIAHGGVSFAPYRRRFHELMRAGRAETREVYSASEGFFAAADRGDGEGMRLLTNASIFYEFVKLRELGDANPRRYWVGDIEPGVEYAVILSTAAGLWGYVLGDTVRFVSINPPRVLVTGRVSYLLSAFGEHLIEEELAEAVSAAAAEIGADAVDYTVAARIAPGEHAGGRHEYVVECQPPPADAAARERFEQALDARLSALNDDYRGLRRKDYNLKPPKVRFAPPGGFVAWMRDRDRLGGQNKVPRVLHDEATFDEIVSFMERHRGE